MPPSPQGEGFHSIDGNKNRIRTNARLSAVAGQLIQNAVPINALKNESNAAAGTYAIACLAKSGDGFVVAIKTIETHNNGIVSVDSVDIAHAVSGRLVKKESSLPATRAQGYQKTAPNSATLTVTIPEFLDVVKGTYQSILSADVLQHFGESRNLDGHYADKVKFSMKPAAEDAQSEVAADNEAMCADPSLPLEGKVARSAG